MWTIISMIITLCVTIAAENNYSLIEIIEKQKSYSGYKVLRIYPKDLAQLSQLHALQLRSSQLDFWTEVRSVNLTIDIMVSPDEFSNFVAYLKKSKIRFSIKFSDIREIVMDDILNRYKENRHNNHHPEIFSLEKYNKLSLIHNFLDDLAEKHSDIVKVKSIGKSYEERKIKLVKIGKSSGQKKPAIWIDAGLHAREWIGPATANFIIDQLVNDYDTNKELVDSIDWYILPVMNVDGYEYSRTAERLWRKTRSRNINSACIGTDGNRNFDFSWNWPESGASNNPCSLIFRGPKPFSEKETKAVAKFITEHRRDIQLYLSLHSYGQMLLLPWGNTSNLPKDFHDLKLLGLQAVAALTSLYGTRYVVGNAYKMLYVTTGSSDDWAKGIAGIKHSYAFELRDTGLYGFMLPSHFILPTAKKTWRAIKVFGHYFQNVYEIKD